jgi:uncharacterized membrane protein
VASQALVLPHILAGSLGLASGFTALFSHKGGRLHRRAGTVFLCSMLAMTVFGFSLAILRHGQISIVPAMLTFYLVASGWRTVTAPPGPPQRLDIALPLLALAAGTTGFVLGWGPLHNASGTDSRGFPAAIYFAFGSVAFLGAALDVRLFVGSGVRGSHRLVRPLWRMCVALWIAASSFFQGQEKVFPQALHGSFLLRIPTYAVIAMMAYWMARLTIAAVRKRMRRSATVPSAEPAG